MTEIRKPSNAIEVAFAVEAAVKALLAAHPWMNREQAQEVIADIAKGRRANLVLVCAPKR